MYCGCGAKSALLYLQNLFPSKPIQPRWVFDISLLQVLHYQLMYGIGKVQSWAEGLRYALQIKQNEFIPSFYKPLLDCYHHWRAVEYNYLDSVAKHLSDVDSVVKNSISLDEASNNLPDDTATLELGKNSYSPSKFSNLCPCCFSFAPEEVNKDVFVCIDGNAQLRRFKDTGGEALEKYPSKLFINVGQRDYPLAGVANKDANKDGVANKDKDKDGCGNSFKATRGWEMTDAYTPPSMRNYDETGVMGMVCRHGIPLRYLNTYTGERATHGIALLRNLYDDLPPGSQIKCCYDVSCSFQGTLTVCYLLIRKIYL